MAKVLVTQVPPVPVKPETQYILTLTEHEAYTLYRIVGHIGGVNKALYEVTSSLYDGLGAALQEHASAEGIRDEYGDLTSKNPFTSIVQFRS